MITNESKLKILKVFEELNKLTVEEKKYFNKVLEVGAKRGGKIAALMLKPSDEVKTNER